MAPDYVDQNREKHHDRNGAPDLRSGLYEINSDQIR
jgi:hypothetical protein